MVESKIDDRQREIIYFTFCALKILICLNLEREREREITERDHREQSQV